MQVLLQMNHAISSQKLKSDELTIADIPSFITFSLRYKTLLVLQGLQFFLILSTFRECRNTNRNFYWSDIIYKTARQTICIYSAKYFASRVFVSGYNYSNFCLRSYLPAESFALMFCLTFSAIILITSSPFACPSSLLILKYY